MAPKVSRVKQLASSIFRGKFKRPELEVASTSTASHSSTGGPGTTMFNTTAQGSNASAHYGRPTTPTAVDDLNAGPSGGTGSSFSSPMVGDGDTAPAFHNTLLSEAAAPDHVGVPLAHDSNASPSHYGDVDVVSANRSVVWSLLFILESVDQYITVLPAPSKAYYFPPSPKADGSPDRVKDFHLNKRHRKLATAVAIIGASSRESSTVTACSTEISFPTETGGYPTITLRVAQNQVVPVAEKKELQGLVDVLVKEVLTCDKSIWDIRAGTFSHNIVS